MNKIPAGTFLVPMLLSALLYTLWPNLFSNLGGITNAFLGGSGTNFIIGLIFFCSGIGINLKTLGKLFKRHGVLLLVKLVLDYYLSPFLDNLAFLVLVLWLL